MPKLSKDEFIAKYKDSIVTDENGLDLAFLEDVTDSFAEEVVDAEALKAEIEDLKSKLADKEAEYDDLRERYKARFLAGSDEIEEKEVEIEEPKEAEVIDIKEI